MESLTSKEQATTATNGINEMNSNNETQQAAPKPGDALRSMMRQRDDAFDKIERLEERVAELERSEDQLIGELDRAQDALQETHIALGGDGEWVGRSPSQPAPDSGDLHLDVPELARERMRASQPPSDAQRELQEALSHEGEKDNRIAALEAALDWAMIAVFEHYTEGEAPAIPGALEEIEQSRARIIAECDRLSLTKSACCRQNPCLHPGVGPCDMPAVETSCGCYNCSSAERRMSVMIVCPKCGNKRCPRGTSHLNDCTGSNEPGQIGSRYRSSETEESSL